MNQVNIEHAKSIAGILLVGVGILLMRQHLHQTMPQVHQFLGNLPSGTLPIVLMDEARQTGQPSGTGFLLHRALGQIFVSIWPLLLVSIGMGLSTEVRR